MEFIKGRVRPLVSYYLSYKTLLGAFEDITTPCFKKLFIHR